MSNITSMQFEEKNLALKNISVGQLLLRHLPLHGTCIAYIDAHTAKERTYEYILNISRKLAIYLRDEGLKMNDVVAICSENNLEFCIPLCAAFYLGAVVCPLNPLYSERELKHALNISKPKYIFISTVAFKNIKNIFKELHWLPKILMLTEYDNDTSWISMYKAISNVSNDCMTNAFQAVPVDTDKHITTILYSSGTTGLPKGVMLTDKNLIAVLKYTINVMQNVENQTIDLALLPFFHAYSFITMTIALIFGNTNIVISRFDEELFLKVIEKYRINQLTLVPSLMVFLAKHPLVDKYDLSSVKIIRCGAAPLSEDIEKAVVKRLNNPIIRQGYGLTETTLAVLLSTGSKTKFGSFLLTPGVSAKVIPLEEYEADKSLGPNCRGELCFKGDLIMKGYCNDAKSTRATIDKDGWLHTGDIGYYDEEGYFYVVDRIKELIKYKGYQVPPAELERILLTCSGIKDVAVVGIPNEEAGELPIAFVVKENNSNIHEEDIIQYVNERVSNPKRLRGGVKFVDSIPRNASGKPSFWMILAYFLAARRESPSLFAPVQTIFPLLNINAVVLGSLIRIMTAANLLGLYSAFLA